MPTPFSFGASGRPVYDKSAPMQQSVQMPQQLPNAMPMGGMMQGAMPPMDFTGMTAYDRAHLQGLGQLHQQVETPHSVSPWADTLSPERQAMYGRVDASRAHDGNAFSNMTPDQQAMHDKAFNPGWGTGQTPNPMGAMLGNPGVAGQIDRGVAAASQVNQEANGWQFPNAQMSALLAQGVAPYQRGSSLLPIDNQGAGIYTPQGVNGGMQKFQPMSQLVQSRM